MLKKEFTEKGSKVLACRDDASFFEEAPHGIFVLDATFLVVKANAEGRRLCPEKLAGLPLWEVFHIPFGNQPALHDYLRDSFDEVMATQVPVAFLLSSPDAMPVGLSEKLGVSGFGLLREGAGTWHLCYKPVFDNDGEIAGILIYLTALDLLDRAFEKLALDQLHLPAPANVVPPAKSILPATSEDATALSSIPQSALAQSKSQNTRPSKASLHILLVEDNEDLRSATSEQLSLLGHRVQSAGDAEQAQMLLKTNKFDLLFTDLTLPKMTGAELARYVLQNFPDVQVVITSGYGRAMADVNDLDALFLAKPYRASDLQNVLWRVIGD